MRLHLAAAPPLRHRVIQEGGSRMKYWAFLSYSHADRKWAEWLHKTIETYRVPRRLVGRVSPDGPIPARLFPVFRDRDELPVSSDLGSKINAALTESRHLIVVCSPQAARSRWVDEEIRAYKKLGREDRILALIVAGEPNASETPDPNDEECFPAAMRYKVGPTGDFVPETNEPLAADVREDRDGRNNAKLKLLSGLLAVDFDELRQRDHERNLRRARTIGAAAVFLMAVLAALAIRATVAARSEAQQRRATQRLLVISDVDRAEQHFGQGDGAGALVYLARATEQDPDIPSAAAMRLWFALTERSWPLPVSAPMPHKGQVLSADFSHDGKRVVTASADGSARVWDAASGRPLTAPLHHPGLVRRALFTPDDRRVLTICFDSFARLWDATSGQAIAGWKVQHFTSINSVAISPSGRWIATGDAAGVVKISESVTGKTAKEIQQPENVHTLFFHPHDDGLLLSVCGNAATLWRIPDGVARFEMRHQSQVNSVAFSPAGETIVTGSSDRTVRLWKTSNGSPIGQPLIHEDDVWNAVVSPDGKLLATVTKHHLRIWEMAAPNRLRYTFDYHQNLRGAAFSADSLVVFGWTDNETVDGHDLLSGEPAGEMIHENGAIVSVKPDSSGERLLIATAKGRTRVWQPPPRFPIGLRLSQSGAVESMSLSPGEHFLLTGSADGKARLWNLDQADANPRLLDHGGEILASVFSPDGAKILTGGTDTSVRVWETVSGAPVGKPLAVDGTVVRLQFSPSGAFFATTTEDGLAQFWDLATQHPLGKSMAHGAQLTSIDFSPDGQRFLTAGADGRVQIWLAPSGEPAAGSRRAEKEITCACFSPKTGLVAAGTGDGTVTLWSVAAPNQPRRQFFEPLAVTDLAFSPDERLLAVGCADQTATIWNVATGRLVGDVVVQAAPISKIVFSSDSTRIATAAEDGVVRVWDAATGRPLTEPLHQEQAARSLLFSRDNRRLFSGSRDGTVRCWDVAASLAPNDRAWLAQFARAVAPVQLNAAGRIEFRSGATRQSLEAEAAPPADAEMMQTLFTWFFAAPAKRTLTPCAKTTLAQYLAKVPATSREKLYFRSQLSR